MVALGKALLGYFAVRNPDASMFPLAQIKCNDTYVKRLPYVWGMDGTYATYATDYIVGIFCFMFGITFLRCAFNMRSAKIKLDEDRHKRDGLPVPSKVDGRTEKLLRRHLEDTRMWLLMLSLSFFACGVAHGLGGFVHQNVSNVAALQFPCTMPPRKVFRNSSAYSDANEYYDEFYILRKPVLPLYILWQFVNIFAAAFGLLVFLLVFQTVIFDAAQFPRNREQSNDVDTVQEEGDRLKALTYSRLAKQAHRYKKTFISCACVVMCILLVYYAVKIFFFVTDVPVEQTDHQSMFSVQFCDAVPAFDKRLIRIWDSRVASIVIASSLLFCTVSFTMLLSLRQSNDDDQDSMCVSPLLHKINSNPRHNTYESDDEEDTTRDQGKERDVTDEEGVTVEPQTGSSQQQRQLRISPFHIRTVRCFGIWIILLAGIIQKLLAISCATNDVESCPLPSSFNHNALFHIVLLMGATVWFYAEYIIYGQEIQAMYVAMKTLKRIRVQWMFTFLTSVNRLSPYNAMEQALLHL